MTDPKARDEIIEVRPYKTLKDVKDFVQLVAEGKTPSWMNLLPDMSLGSEYCTPHKDLLKYPRPALKRNSVPKTLLCHDYRGGYLNDRFLSASLEDGNIYEFKQWCLIDTFVYFSHYLVTVPTPCYIAAAHAHGVPILGTLITEGQDGELSCREFLKDDGKDFAEDLATICKVHKFDGYLINIENILSIDEVPKMVNFLRYLRNRLPEECQIIWYDAVTTKGKLHWQNELNQENYEFFNVCDGIFLNYNYKMENLEMSSVRAAYRKHDVYVGVDIFGRGCPGSGFAASDAVKMARAVDLSVAIFAPAWTKEVVPGNASKNDDIFWASLSKYLYVHGINGTNKSEFILAGDGRYSSQELSTVIYPSIMPALDQNEERRILVQFQRDLQNYSHYYKCLGKPILEMRSVTPGYKLIFIDKSSKFQYRFIPLILFERILRNGLDIILSCYDAQETPSSLNFYFIIENPRNMRKELFKAKFLTNQRTTQSFPGLLGTLLEFGVEMPPLATLYIQNIEIKIRA